MFKKKKINLMKFSDHIIIFFKFKHLVLRLMIRNVLEKTFQKFYQKIFQRIINFENFINYMRIFIIKTFLFTSLRNILQLADSTKCT